MGFLGEKYRSDDYGNIFEHTGHEGIWVRIGVIDCRHPPRGRDEHDLIRKGADYAAAIARNLEQTRED